MQDRRSIIGFVDKMAIGTIRFCFALFCSFLRVSDGIFVELLIKGNDGNLS